MITAIVCVLGKVGLAEKHCLELRASIAIGAGSGAYIRGNYERCYEILSPYMEVEDDLNFGGIKYQLAILFYYGRGVTLNRPVANKLFREAAALGWEDAQKYLSQFEGPYKTRT